MKKGKELDGEPSILPWKPLIFNVSEITGIMDSSLIMNFFAKNQNRGFFKHSKNHSILLLNLQDLFTFNRRFPSQICFSSDNLANYDGDLFKGQCSI
jgi:hypothetical protein